VPVLRKRWGITRQVDREARKQRQLAEAHDRHKDKDMPGLAQKLEYTDSGNERANKGNGKNRFASVNLREFRERDHPEEGAGVLHDHVYTGHMRRFAGHLLQRHVLRFENF